MKSGCYVIHDASTLLDVASSTRCGNYPRAFCAKETKQLTPCGSVSTVCTASLRKSAEPASCHGGRPRLAKRCPRGRVSLQVCTPPDRNICFAARRLAIYYKNRGEPPISHFCAGIRNWRFIGRGLSPVARGPRVALRPSERPGWPSGAPISRGSTVSMIAFGGRRGPHRSGSRSRGRPIERREGCLWPDAASQGRPPDGSGLRA